MQVVDSHIHLWDLKTHRYPWLENPGVSFVGDARALKHDYLLDNLLAEADDIDVKKLVHVEANHDPADPVEETRWLQGIADRAESRGMPNAIVAAVDLASPNAPAVLEAHASFANTRGHQTTTPPLPLSGSVGNCARNAPLVRKRMRAVLAHAMAQIKRRWFFRVNGIKK